MKEYCHGSALAPCCGLKGITLFRKIPLQSNREEKVDPSLEAGVFWMALLCP